jgi:peptidyl-prolyl cis-trans isomerase SurA
MKRLCLPAIPSLALLLLLPSSGRAEIMERVVVKVNGDIITLSDFESRQIMAIQAAGIGADKFEAYLREHNAKILQDAVDDLLIVQRADELEIKLPPEAVNGVIENIKKENHLATDDELREQLRREGMTFDDLKRNISQTYLKRAVLQRELERKVAPTEEDIRVYYEAHKDEYTLPATVHLQEIHIKADIPGARAKAVEVVTRARAGEDFAELASSFSAPTAGGGNGDLGVVSLKELSPTIQKAAAPLQVGEVSDPVSSADGFRVFKLLARTDASVTPLDQVRNRIRNQLMDAKGNEAYDKYVEELRKNAIIDVKVREVPLQVSRPVGPTTFLEPPSDDVVTGPARPPEGQGAPGAGPPPPSPSAEDAEISTSPQEAPEHVAPPGASDGQDKDKKDQPRR